MSARASLAGLMTEDELLTAVLEHAAARGWLCYHPRPARIRDGWATPGQGNGAAGFPDLTLARGGRVIFAELKTEKGQVTPGQERWLNALRRPVTGADAPRFDEGTVTGRTPAPETYVWRPSRWLDGTIESVLR